MKKKALVFGLSSISGGFGMWVTGGLWHNLLLPLLNNKFEAHHEGIFIGLIAYFILAFIMGIFISSSTFRGTMPIKGIKVGIIIGIAWVFPHGLTMAGVHGTSIMYEVFNTLYHIFEQGIGGIIISLVFKGFANQKAVAPTK